MSGGCLIVVGSSIVKSCPFRIDKMHKHTDRAVLALYRGFLVVNPYQALVSLSTLPSCGLLVQVVRQWGEGALIGLMVMLGASLVGHV